MHRCLSFDEGASTTSSQVEGSFTDLSPFYVQAVLTHACGRIETTWKTCRVCVKLTNLANIAQERLKKGSKVTNLVPPNDKVSARFSMELRDSSKHQLADSRLFAKCRAKQPRLSRRSTKSLIGHFIKHRLNSLHQALSELTSSSTV